MKQRELFDAGVRMVGVVMIAYGIWDLTHAGLFYADYFRNPDSSVRFYLVAGWVSITAGLLFVRAGNVLVNFAYGPLSENGENIGLDD